MKTSISMMLLLLFAGCTTTTYQRGDVKITHQTPMIFGKHFDKLDIQRVGEDATLTIENYNSNGVECLAGEIAAGVARGLK